METIDFLLDRPFELFMLLFVGALIGIAVERGVARSDAAKCKAWWAKKRKSGSGGKFSRGDASQREPELARSDFAAEQLKAVCRADFSARALLNRSESKVFDALDKAVIARNPSWQVMAQVNLGEFLASPCDEAYRAINTKRVDFALMDEKCRVRHAIEYQGSGHHTGASAAARDAVKKEALRKAGIGYHEVVAGHTTPGDLRVLVERLVVG